MIFYNIEVQNSVIKQASNLCYWPNIIRPLIMAKEDKHILEKNQMVQFLSFRVKQLQSNID